MKASSLAALALMSAGCAAQAPTIGQTPESKPAPTVAHVTAENPPANTDRAVAMGPMGQPSMGRSRGGPGMGRSRGGPGIRQGNFPRARGRYLPPTTFMGPAQPVPMGPFDVTPGRAPQTQDEWDYVLSRLSWGQKMTLINQIKGQVGMQPSVFPPYSGPPTSAPQDPWAGRGGIRSTPDTTFLPPQPQPVPVTGE